MRRIGIYLGDLPLGEAVAEVVRGRETWMFRFSEEALAAHLPMIDPAIMNVKGPQFPMGRGGFGFLSDVAPDRWGRKLIRRRAGRDLLESDYIIGVCDLTRAGAVRVKVDGEDGFASADLGNAAPPWTTLRKLEEAARHLDADGARGDDERWLRDLFAPGSSLGGARPKANVTAPDGSLWIAKFPSVRDECDVGAEEYRASLLARRAGIRVPETKAQKLSKAGTTFFSKRFDRDGARRIHYASAMTMLGATDGEDGHSYLEIAEWLSANSADADADLRELWSRMAFSQLIGNTDDHLRNHGFLLGPKGWRLSPAFDVNPGEAGGEHALDMGDLMADCAYYRMTRREAEERYAEIKAVVG